MDVPRFLLDLLSTLLVILVSCFNNLLKIFSPTKKCIKNQIALVTGSGSGLGRGLSLKLSELGCTLVLVDINQKDNNETGQMIRDKGGDCIIYTCDLTDKEQIDILAEKVKKEVGDIEILVNNAGVAHGKHLDELSDREIQQSFNLNILSHFWLTKQFLPGMTHLNSGHIVNIASVAGFFGNNRMTDYCATKFAVIGFTESLKEELRFRNYAGVKTTCVCPYFIDTGMFDGVEIKYDFWLKNLKTQEVADKIVDAMLMDQEVLVLPRRINILISAKTFLPVKVVEALSDLLQVNASMKNYRGRK